MKKLLTCLVIIFMIVFASWVNAAEVTTSRKVAWEQDEATFAVMDHWELFWSDAAGGPYVKITNIGKPTEPPIDGIHTLDPIELTVSGQMGKTVTKYFVIQAVMAEGEVSGWSNEALSDFKIAMGKPFNLIMEVYTIPE